MGYNCQQAPCPGNPVPTFWSSHRLKTVTTRVRDGGGWRNVDRWTLVHSFPDAGDTDPSLWLKRIEHVGLAGGTLALPDARLDGTKFANRTDFNTTAGIPKAFKYRLTTIDNGTGGQLLVAYEGSDCTQSSQAPPAENPKRCFRQHLAPPGGTSTWSWWNKYRVASVTERDLVGGSPDVLHTYGYSVNGSSSAVLWHHNDDSFSTPIDFRDWSIWRGYATVTVTDGSADGVRSFTRYLYFRGMHGDRTAAGPGTRVATISDSDGVAIDDSDNLAGFLREKTVHDGVDGPVRYGEIHDPWQHQSAVRTLPPGWGTPSQAWAFFTRTAKTRTRRWRAHNSTWQRTQTEYTFDTTYGLPVDVRDLGNPSIAADSFCTHTDYARNTAAWLVDFPSQTVTTTCAATPSGADFLAGTQTLYDNTTVIGTPPTTGLATKTLALAAASGTTLTWAQSSRASYDSHGRVQDAFDALNRKTTTAYIPAAGGPLTGFTVTNPLLHTVTTALDPAWGVTTRTVDANTKTTDAAYDPLGRLVSVWLPGRDRGLSGNSEYVYAVRDTAASSVTTRQLGPNGNQIISHELYDGHLRLRQVQKPAAQATGGRIITDTAYDGRGLTAKSSLFWNSAAPADVLVAFSDANATRQTTTLYDTLSRATNVTTKSNGVELWHTSTAHDGDRAALTPPPGGTATTTVTDARGNTIELRQHQGGTPAGAFTATTYTVDRLSRLTGVTEAGNEWTWTFDRRGRIANTTDPDKGAATLTYDDAGQLLTTTDARPVTIAYSYDDLGRRSGMFRDSTSGTQLAGYLYDTLAKGQRTSATRYVAGQAYTTAVTGYDDSYRPLGLSAALPATEGTLVGTHTTSLSYAVDGSPATVGFPDAGGLSAETVSSTYDNVGRPLTTAGLSTYVSGTTYHPLGEAHQLLLGTGTNRVRLTNTVDAGSGRLTAGLVDTEVPGAPNTWANQWEQTYGYDPAGTVTQIVERQNAAAVSAQCFTYDHLRQLLEAWTNSTATCATAPGSVSNRGPDPYWQTYSYVGGKRQTETRHGMGGAGDTLRTYSYPVSGAVRPHGLTQVVSTGAVSGTDAYGYDPAGNTTSRTVTGVAQTMTWTEDNRLATHTAAGQATSYVYDADGNRLLRKNPDGSATAYLPGGWELAKNAAGTLTATRYYAHGGTMVATRGALGLHWQASDHHGTGLVIVRASDLAATKRRSLPFGEPRGAQPAWPTDRGFLGAPTDPSGLVHLGAREYDPAIGRFLSVDPLIVTDDPQQLNPYSYGGNNPTTFSDPSGTHRCPADQEDTCQDTPPPGGPPSLPPSQDPRPDPCANRPCGGNETDPDAILSRGTALNGDLIIAPTAAELQRALQEAEAAMCRWRLFCSRDSWLWAGQWESFAHSHICQANPDWCGDPWQMLPADENGIPVRIVIQILPAALKTGRMADPGIHVYRGVIGKTEVYAGITNNPARRRLEHGGRFAVDVITDTTVRRGEARAIEQALIVRSRQPWAQAYQNLRNSIDPNHPYYQAAVDWGEAWLRSRGL